MALGKHSRADGRKSSSNYCSTVTIVMFVALCLVGVWMMTSSSVVPVQNSNLATQQEINNEAIEKEQVIDHHENVLDGSSTESKTDKIESGVSGNEGNEGKVKQFEDNPGDLPEDTTKGDTNVNLNQEDNNSNSHEAEIIPQVKKDEAGSMAEEGSQTDTGNGEGDNEQKDPETGNGEEEKGDSEKKDSEVLKTNETNAREVDSGGVQKSESNEKASETTDLTKNDAQTEEKSDEMKDSGEKSMDGQSKEQSLNEVLPSSAQSELMNERTVQNGSFSTQKAKSKNEKEAQESSKPGKQSGYHWKLCNVTAGPDYIPCLDNLEAIRHLRSTKHYEHRERHCPDNPPTCLVSLPDGYQPSIEWPSSREKIWYHNVPHTKLAQVKGHQNWVKVSGEFLTFPGGGTQFKNGALHYIDFIQQSLPDVAWGKRSRVVLDVGCGVASFGGYLFDRDVLAMSLAPKDEHEAQIQFALERGIPAISAVMGTTRLPYPGRAFDVVHCARCRVPWHIEGGKLLLELNRLLRPGGFFIWSATPVYQKLPEDVEIWEAMKKLTKAMCWEVVSIIKDKVNSVGIAIYRKPLTNECYESRSQMEPPLCSDSDDPSAAWNVALQACIHKVPVAETERGFKWPESGTARLQKPPYWLLKSQVGVYGKPAPDDFATDYEYWKRVVNKSYLNELGIKWSSVRNVMDMRAIYGGFAAALRDMKLWVMNVVSIDAPDTLPIIYERGLFGIYHDWCESFSTYPRSFDLLHADHLFSKIKRKCNFLGFVVEVDRILRPGGNLIVRDHADVLNELTSMFKSMEWEIKLTFAKDNEGLLCVHKSMWRPKEMETVTYAIG